MKALVFTAPNEMTFRDEPEPGAPGPGEVVVKITACGICGSDMHAYHGHDMVRRPPPLILGHEGAGTIVGGPRDGERVAINPLMTCGSCDACEDGREHVCAERRLLSMKGDPGAFAEFVKLPSRNAVSMPDGMSFDVAALTEPMAVAYHAVGIAERATPRSLSRARVAVIGGGAIGLCVAHVLESRGVREIAIAEPSELRRKPIRDAGRFHAYDPAANDAPGENSMDVVLDAFGGEASRAAACRLVRPGGVIVHIGLASAAGGVDVRKVTLQEIMFIGTYCYTMLDFRETLRGLAEGRFGAIDWVEPRSMSDGVGAFKDLDRGAVAAAKIMLKT